MNKNRCPKCKSFIASKFVTHSGGDCKRCGTHIVPEWYTWGLANRPLGGNAQPMAPWSDFVTVLPQELDKLGLMSLINFHMGLELPDDMSKVYFAPYLEPEFGPVDISDEMALSCAGMVGMDDLHNALLIICGALAEPSGTSRTNAIMAASLCYYMATRMCISSGHPRESEVEREVRDYNFDFLQDAVAFVFDRFGLVHTASVEYITRQHPRWF